MVAQVTWDPEDTSQPGFVAECRRQSLLVAQADAADEALGAFLDAALADLDEPSLTTSSSRPAPATPHRSAGRRPRPR
ncbi:antitoxin MazE family protein [Methylobacterium sp. E-005]|uniref:antitoxin MazE-like protein n=1 Tax=Methylobacterium sp. E-005 TaxID=2836549 RepID=UPI001FBB27A7|nr:antitoxin MazE-like protein [Methylobacterium sp. E-005]MCJ2088791.1 antitoxin MazE family protein [Methylobacterium sp. E-005]